MQRPSGKRACDVFWKLAQVQRGWSRVGEGAEDEARDISRGPPVPCSSKRPEQTSRLASPGEPIQNTQF